MPFAFGMAANGALWRQGAMWHVKAFIDRMQVAFLLWRLHRHRPASLDVESERPPQ